MPCITTHPYPYRRIDFVTFRTESGYDFLGVYENISPQCASWNYASSSQPQAYCYAARLYSSGFNRPSSIVTTASSISFSFTSDATSQYTGVHMRIGPCVYARAPLLTAPCTPKTRRGSHASNTQPQLHPDPNHTVIRSCPLPRRLRSGTRRRRQRPSTAAASRASSLASC